MLHNHIRPPSGHPHLLKLNGQVELEHELDQLTRDHLGPLDTLNLSFYLNEFETSSCDLSDLLSNLMQNVLVKLPDPMIKYRFLNCIKRLYVDQTDQQRVSDEGFDEDELSGSFRSNLSPAKRQLDQRLFEATTRRYLVASSLLKCRSIASISSSVDLDAKQQFLRRSRRRRRASRLSGPRLYHSVAPTPSTAPGRRNLRQVVVDSSSSDAADDDGDADDNDSNLRHRAGLDGLPQATESHQTLTKGSSSSPSELQCRSVGSTFDGPSSNTAAWPGAARHHALTDVADTASRLPQPTWKQQHYQPLQPSQQGQQRPGSQRQHQQQLQIEAPLDPSSDSSSIRPSRLFRSLPEVSMYDPPTYLASSARGLHLDGTGLLTIPPEADCRSGGPVTFAGTAYAIDYPSLSSLVDDYEFASSLGRASQPDSSSWLASIQPDLAYLGQRDPGHRVSGQHMDYNELAANDARATWTACSSCEQYGQLAQDRRSQKVVTGSEEQNGFSLTLGAPARGFQQPPQQHSKLPTSTVSSSLLAPCAMAQQQTTNNAARLQGALTVQTNLQVQQPKLGLQAYDYLADTGWEPAAQARRHANGFRAPDRLEWRPDARCFSSMSVPCDRGGQRAHYQGPQELTNIGEPLAGAHLVTGRYQECQGLGRYRRLASADQSEGPFEGAVLAGHWAARGFRTSLPASPVAHDKLGQVCDQRRLEAFGRHDASNRHASQLNKTRRNRQQHHRRSRQANHPNEPLFTPNRQQLWGTLEQQPEVECRLAWATPIGPTAGRFEAEFDASGGCQQGAPRRLVGGEDAVEGEGELQGEQRPEEQVEESEGDDEEEALAIVAAPVDGRLSMSVAEQVSHLLSQLEKSYSAQSTAPKYATNQVSRPAAQMKAQASSFVQQYGSSSLTNRSLVTRGKSARIQGRTGSGNSASLDRSVCHKPELQVRRTLRVKIKKSKPILGIAIEGGFNVSGQLLPRIVCVHVSTRANTWIEFHKPFAGR